jgi:hypothetical protein
MWGKSAPFLKLTLSDGINSNEISNISDFCFLPAVYGSASGLFASVMDVLYDFFFCFEPLFGGPSPE